MPHSLFVTANLTIGNLVSDYWIHVFINFVASDTGVVLVKCGSLTVLREDV